MTSMMAYLITTGAGLTETEINKLFTPFERLGAGENIEGAGIGLVICKYFCQLMGGDVGVHSTKGQGSNFWVELPLFKHT